MASFSVATDLLHFSLPSRKWRQLIQVIDSTNACLYSETLRSFSALRYEVFVKQLGWQLPCQEPGFECDEFDDGNAIYLVVADDSGRVVGGARLLDTARRSLLGEIFPYLVDGPPPAHPRIFEVTRFVTAPSTAQNSRNSRPSRNFCMELLWALQAYGMWAGLTHLVSVSYLGLEPILRRAGYRFHRLGRVVPMDGWQVAALMHDVDGATLARVRQRLDAACGLMLPSPALQLGVAAGMLGPEQIPTQQVLHGAMQNG